MTENELYPEQGTQACPKRGTYLVWGVQSTLKVGHLDLIINQGIPRSRLKYLEQGMVVCCQQVSHI